MQRQPRVDLTGGEYILFSLDDFTQNYASNGSIGIGVPENKLSIPSYASKIGHDPLVQYMRY